MSFEKKNHSNRFPVHRLKICMGKVNNGKKKKKTISFTLSMLAPIGDSMNYYYELFEP